MHETLKAYLDRRILIITGKMTGDTLSYVQESISTLLLKPITEITLIISTSGGNYSLEIFDLLRLYPGKKVGLVVNCAQSAGAIILQACDLRLATPNSKILIHHGATGEVKYDLLMDQEKTQQFLLDSRKAIEARYNIFTSRTGRSRAEISSLCFQDRNLSPEEAIKYGLLDQIWTGPLPISETGLKWEQKT
jgi:ATP-dependent Clp protease protease subunit